MHDMYDVEQRAPCEPRTLASLLMERIIALWMVLSSAACLTWSSEELQFYQPIQVLEP